MSTVEDIERAISELAPADLARLRTWFEEFEAGLFDRKIEEDARAGKLDRIADQVEANFYKGLAREL